MIRIAYFITPHGFGHAARASAVMQALADRLPDIQFEIFTTVPEWFFKESLTCAFHYHRQTVDIGLVQATPLVENLDKTLSALDEFLPFSKHLVSRLAACLAANNCCLVICDISPLGLTVAHQAQVPSLLIENFTWDWIYEGYLDLRPEFKPFIAILKDVFSNCDYHIQTQPLCLRNSSAQLCVPPISRKAGYNSAQIREKLHILPESKVILFTMGGIHSNYPRINKQSFSNSSVVIIPGGSKTIEREENIILLPHHSTFYHPDLIEASNVVIGKIGYSTIAETYYAGIPFGFIPREHFRESSILAQFIRHNIPSISISPDDLNSPHLLEKTNHLLSLNSKKPDHPNGAFTIAAYILSHIIT